MYCAKEPKKIRKFEADQEKEQKERDAKEHAQREEKAANRAEVREAFERVGLVLEDGYEPNRDEPRLKAQVLTQLSAEVVDALCSSKPLRDWLTRQGQLPTHDGLLDKRRVDDSDPVGPLEKKPTNFCELAQLLQRDGAERLQRACAHEQTAKARVYTPPSEGRTLKHGRTHMLSEEGARCVLRHLQRSRRDYVQITKGGGYYGTMDKYTAMDDKSKVRCETFANMAPEGSGPCQEIMEAERFVKLLSAWDPAEYGYLGVAGPLSWAVEVAIEDAAQSSSEDSAAVPVS